VNGGRFVGLSARGLCRLGIKTIQRPIVEKQKHKRQCNEHRFCYKANSKKYQTYKVSKYRRSFYITNIGGQCKQPEQGAQDILALGYPGDRFDVHRMNRKCRCDKCAWPERVGHFSKNRKEQQGICKVEKQIYKMHPAWVGAEQLTIQHQGQPRQGLPVSEVAGCKRPDNAVRGQAVQNVLVFVYVEIIVIIDKIEIADLPEDQQGTQYQDNIHENNERFFRRFRHNS